MPVHGGSAGVLRQMCGDVSRFIHDNGAVMMDEDHAMLDIRAWKRQMLSSISALHIMLLVA